MLIEKVESFIIDIGKGRLSMQTWEIEKMFRADIREKKQVGTGAYHRRGKGVKHGVSGALRTPFFYMSGKEKRKLNGEVKVFNMFTTILDWDQFQLKDKQTQKELMTKWREVYTNSQIMEQLEVGRKSKFNMQSFNDLIHELGVPKKRRVNSSETKKSKQKNNKSVAVAPLKLYEEDNVVPDIQPVQAQTIIINGLHLEYNGTYDVESLNRLFTKLQLLVDGEPSKYQINLSLSEITKN